MGQYYLKGNTYVIEDFDKEPAFSSFLPGLAGVKGIPLWVYYTNRGQGINSFGIHNKNNAIMEFNPANTAFENTAIKGFRTFIRCNGEYLEPFFAYDKEAKRNIYIRKNSFTVEEMNLRYGIKITIKYYVLPNDSVGALVRKVWIENTDKETKSIEVLDGLPKIIPYGIKNGDYKEMSNLLKSWSDIKNIQNNIPYYTMRASSDDSAEVSEIDGGYYYLSVYQGNLLPVIYDAEVVFGYDNSLVNPIEFIEADLNSVIGKPQCFANKIPCGFTAVTKSLEQGESICFHTMVGFVSSPEQITKKREELCRAGYFEEKEQQAEDLVEELTGDVRTYTVNPIFDQYVEQCYLDNFLRGGYPFVFNKDKNKSVIHLFSRKHGDPERDYNFFSIAGEAYSQGNGNFRDVSQNRRNDVFFKKDIGDFNIKTFFDLIQIDGYNPLEVRPTTFLIKKELKEAAMALLVKVVKSNLEPLKKTISNPFTPGQVAGCLARHHIALNVDEDVFLQELLLLSTQNTEAGFGEGYWSDHWDYNLDLIENYLKIYPDKIKELLFQDESYRFYDSAARVLPRIEKYVVHKGQVRQYGSLIEDEEKAEQNDFQKAGTNWLKTITGTIAKTTLIVKLISLGLNKFTTLDPFGMGVEMEGGKPGWNDAMNGLPGLIGSGMPETFELKRLIEFISANVILTPKVLIPIELYDFLIKVSHALELSRTKGWSDYHYWDKVSSLKEHYRAKTRFGLDGNTQEMSTSKIAAIFQEFSEKIEAGIQKACGYGDGIVPTYFTYHAREFETVLDQEGKPALSHYGKPKAVVTCFEVQPLPCFLEGPARMLGTIKDKKTAQTMCNQIKESKLYDKKLKMYKTSVPIDSLSMENGRIRAFTPGWLERESIFLHMEYKYLLAMQKAGLWDLFYQEMQTALIPFLPPQQYGRSILENSSFIASSENPNSQIHGRGYVARLSGSTTELLSMWIEMFMGSRVFSCDGGLLKLHFEPNLPGWLFDGDGKTAFTLLSKCKVTYHNPSRKNTYGEHGARIQSIVIEDNSQVITKSFLEGDLAQKVREGEITAITVHMD